MINSAKEAGGTGPSHRSVEIGVALVMALLAVIGIIGGIKVGIGWGAEGPQAGFFPFYISLIVLIACAVNLVHAFSSAGEQKLFAEWSQLRQVFSVVVPTAIYVALIPFIGIYVSSALLIGVFMRWFGKYNWGPVVGIALLVPVLTFFMFEVWFLVSLPKGPLEHALGF